MVKKLHENKTQLKRRTTAEKKKDTYSFIEVKPKLMKELEKEKEIAKQEKEIEELEELKTIIAIKLLNRACMEIKKKKEEEKKNNMKVIKSSEEPKNNFNDNNNLIENPVKYDSSGPSGIQEEDNLEKYRSTWHKSCEAYKNCKLSN